MCFVGFCFFVYPKKGLLPAIGMIRLSVSDWRDVVRWEHRVALGQLLLLLQHICHGYFTTAWRVLERAIALQNTVQFILKLSLSTRHSTLTVIGLFHYFE